MADKLWWDEVYRAKEIPWDVGVPSAELIKAVERGDVKACRALDVCCGTGTESIYLAKRGFSVSAIDVSKEAIRVARKKAKGEANVRFAVASTMKIPFKDKVFGFVNDRGCFHVFEPEQRKSFAEEVNRILEHSGVYLMRCFSEKEPGELGPYRISKQEITSIFSALFEILRINETELRGKTSIHKGYECLMKKRR